MESVGRLFRKGYPGALTCRWSLHGTELLLIPLDLPEAEAQHTYSLDVQGAELKRGGAEDDQLSLSQGELTFYAPRRLLEPQLRALRLHSTSAALQREERRATSRGRSWWLLAAALLVLMTGLAGGAWLLSGLLIDRAVGATPVAWDVQIGQAAYTAQDDAAREIKDARVQAPLQTLVDQISQPFAGRGFQFKVHVIRSPQVNAFALPGGTMAIYTGLLQQADGADEVAGVLAHEIQHVVLRHGLRSLYGRLRWQAAVFLLAGNSDSLLHALLSSGASLSTLSYSREMESQADLGGAELLRSQGFKSGGLVKFLSRRRDGDGVSRYFSSHPPSAERSAALRSAGEGTATRPFPLDWTALREALGPTVQDAHRGSAGRP